MNGGVVLLDGATNLSWCWSLLPLGTNSGFKLISEPVLFCQDARLSFLTPRGIVVASPQVLVDRIECSLLVISELHLRPRME
jgi:hypothetical protein